MQVNDIFAPLYSVSNKEEGIVDTMKESGSKVNDQDQSISESSYEYIDYEREKYLWGKN